MLSARTLYVEWSTGLALCHAALLGSLEGAAGSVKLYIGFWLLLTVRPNVSAVSRPSASPAGWHGGLLALT